MVGPSCCLPGEPRTLLASFVSQSQDIPKAKQVSKFDGFVLNFSAPISLGLEIPESGEPLRDQWDDKGA